MSIYPERAAKPKIGDSLQKTGFATAIFAINQVKGGRKTEGI
jgi:hypothetical protein